MANRVIGEVSFKLGGKDYTMCFDNDALVQLEDQLDIGIVAITTEMQKWGKEPERVRLKWIRAMLWSGLRKHHPNMTIKQAGELIDSSSGGEVMDTITNAMQKAFGDSETKEARPTNGGDSTGTGSDLSQTTSPSDSASIASGDLPRAN
jgi:hypothetical protein